VRPTSYTFHLVTLTDGNVVDGIEAVTNSPIRINGGYFFFRNQIFDYIGENEDLIDQPFARLIERQELVAYPYDGFWAPLDTLKDKHNLEALIETGRPPWAVWNSGHHTEPDAASS
jgi:glucose-1-phosphate cytidylyltransferase